MGEERTSKVKLAIEQDVSGSQGPKSASRKLALGFDFVEESKVDALSPDGTAQITARLADAVGSATGGADQKMVDDFALALDELKISFKRSSRGEIVALLLGGLRAPLEEGTARAMLNAMYSAQRGPILPEGPVDVGGTWKVDTALPPSTGFTGLIAYNYTYARKGGGVAIISCVGTIDGKGGPGAGTRKMAGKSVSEYRLEIATGKIIGSSVDSDVQIDQNIPGQQTISSGVKQHVHAEWTLQVK
ncbi:MAG TPA: hypothetical protein VMZ28_18030 [Kofleriaceae bacterium]|nr:hypothetical protein [Kofleriaceae bacterium]